MSITPLKKATLCGVLKDKPAMLEGLQALGCMHLLPLRPPPAEVEKAVSPRAEAAYRALRFLSDVKDKRRQVRRDPDFAVERFVNLALDLKQRLRDAEDRRDFLIHRIGEVEPWGDIDFPPRETLADYRLWFYRLPLKHLKSLRDIGYPWEIVRKDNRFAYLVLIAAEEPPAGLLPVPRTHTGALPLTGLYDALEDTEILLEALHAERQALTRYIYLLSVNLAEAENRASLAHAEQQTHDDDALVAVQGWVPEDAVEAVAAFAEEKGLAVLIEDPAPEDKPPTLIDQPETMAAGADLTLFYQVPSYRSWDPTGVLVGSFCIFFAMILADAGYAAALLLGILLYWRRFDVSTKRRAYRRLALALTGCGIVYGVMVGSYFGLTPPQGSFPERLHILDINDFDTMMRVSILVGALHVCLANAMLAWARLGSRSAISRFGWIAAIVGGTVLWLSGMTGRGLIAGTALIVAGAGLILLFTSDRPVRKPVDRAFQLVDGIRGLGRVMNAFGDVLSYMRLFALGLASASLALTFNDLAAGARNALPGLGVLVGGLILVLGHTLNLTLGVMSGVVHGLRLNFIEFYNWGLPEEGTAFRRFARKEVRP